MATPWLKSFEISGYRGYNENQKIEFSAPVPDTPGSGLNIVVGPNNGGKSALFEGIDLAVRAQTLEIPRTMRHDATDYSARLHLTWNDGFITSMVSKPDNPIQLVSNGSPPQPRPIQFIAAHRDIPQQIAQPQPSKRDDMLKNSQVVFNRTSGEGWISRRIPAWRSAGSRFHGLLSQVLDFPIKITHEGQNVHVKVGGHEHDPKGLGAGVVSVLHLVDAVHDAQDGAVLVIDEPESALHPSYQRKILKLFAEESKRLQIIYATHSPYMVDWDAILTGASLSRVHRPIGGYSKISSLKRETAAALAGFQKNLRNPHILGTNAKEVFFLSDGIILVEGQDDVVYFREMASQMGETFDGDFYGWGVGGAENMPKIVQLLQDLGFERVVGVVDNNKPAVREQMEKQFPSYKFLMLPAEDVRDKDGKDGKSIKGLCSSGGKIHEDRIDDVRKFFAGLREALTMGAKP